MTSVIEQFVEWAHEGLLQSEEAQQYLLGRGVSSSQWRTHRLGYVIGCFHPDLDMDPQHSSACMDKDAKGKRCDSCRLMRWSSDWQEDEDGGFVPNVGQRIIGNVVLPLTSYSGATVGFQMRSIRGKVFDSFLSVRKPEGFFFGIAPNMASIWSRKKVFVVEAPFDHLVFERLIAPNVVAMTTSAPGLQQTKFFRRFVDEVILLLDMDKGGREGIKSIQFKMDDEGPSVRGVRFEISNRKGGKCKDLNEAWAVLGDSSFKRTFADLIGG